MLLKHRAGQLKNGQIHGQHDKADEQPHEQHQSGFDARGEGELVAEVAREVDDLDAWFLPSEPLQDLETSVATSVIHEEGLQSRWQRHREAHSLFVDRIADIGLSLFTPEGHRLPMLNVVSIPDGVDDAAVRGTLRDRGIEISGGFGPLAGRVWRIGLMGTNANPRVVNRLVTALAEALGR